MSDQQNKDEVTLRGPSGETVRTSDQNEIKRLESQGYERVDDDE